MKIKNIFALIVIILATSLASVAQTIAPTTVPVTVVPAPPAAPPPSPGDTLAKPPEAAVVAHGTALEAPPAENLPLTNEPASDEVLETVAFDAIPLPDAVRALALQAGLNIQFDPRLLTTVGPDGHAIPSTPPAITEKWKKVTARQALTALLENWNWQLVLDPRSKIGRITA